MANQMGLLAAILGQQGSLDALGRGHDSAVKRFDTNYYDPYSSATSGAPGMLASTPFRDAPGSKSECEAQARAYARDQAPLLAKIGEPMDAGCVKVND